MYFILLGETVKCFFIEIKFVFLLTGFSGGLLFDGFDHCLLLFLFNVRNTSDWYLVLLVQGEIKRFTIFYIYIC